MKRLCAVVMISVILVLSACSTKEPLEEEGDAAIQPAKLSNYEKNLTQIMAMENFAYDVNIHDEEVRAIETTIDYYKNGELMGTFAELESHVNDDNSIRTVFLRQKLNENEEKWVCSHMDENGQSSGMQMKEFEGREELNSSAWGGLTEPTPLYIGEKLVIASLVFSNKNGISIYSDLSTEEALKQQTDYEQVYIISIELK
ncbi:hypothetical protein [Oceanobacillus senegalensis]|uniref:hypothetical protein n=1 Tax=Oceanobacillus senegalensis TaxID=1936063 RepID=UPI000A30A68A|nr:hypothetical protein [Oceanobacillus senegalensis]